MKCIERLMGGIEYCGFRQGFLNKESLEYLSHFYKNNMFIKGCSIKTYIGNGCIKSCCSNI